MTNVQFNNTTIKKLITDFDSIRSVDEDGNEYWAARELMSMLGYRKYERMEDAIQRAIASCQNAENPCAAHFRAEARSNGGRPREDYRLTRYACYLVAMSSDPRKPEVALAQSYFAVKLTTFDELVKRLTGHSCDIFPEISNFERDLSGFVYLIEAKELARYKIGYSKEVYKRATTIQISTPVEICVIYRYFSTDAPQLEKLLHQYYDAYRVRGEWFELPKSEVSNFLVVANELDQNIELNLRLINQCSTK